jgi:hypothetical protein
MDVRVCGWNLTKRFVFVRRVLSISQKVLKNARAMIAITYFLFRENFASTVVATFGHAGAWCHPCVFNAIFSPFRNMFDFPGKELCFSHHTFYSDPT